jgi:hypothetical protein
VFAQQKRRRCWEVQSERSLFGDWERKSCPTPSTIDPVPPSASITSHVASNGTATASATSASHRICSDVVKRNPLAMFQPVINKTRLGTRNFSLDPYREPDSYNTPLVNEFQTITFQRECRRYSLEELRVADYVHAQAEKSGVLSATASSVGVKPVLIHPCRTWEWVVGRARLELSVLTLLFWRFLQ